MAVQSLVNHEEQRLSIRKMQEKFSITSVKGEDIFPTICLLCANKCTFTKCSLPSFPPHSGSQSFTREPVEW